MEEERWVPWRFREVEPPTVVKSGKAVGQTTTWTSRLRLGDGFDMISFGWIEYCLGGDYCIHAKQLSSFSVA